MEKVYTDADYLAIYNQRRKVLAFFYLVTGVYLAFCIGLLIFHITLPYADPLDALPRGLVYLASIGYALFAFPYLTIKYRRVNSYYRLFKHFGEALKMEETYYFYGYVEEPVLKGHVDAYSCVFATWNKRAHEWMEREIYVDAEKPLPPFERGDMVHYVTQSNFLLAYEIVEKHAIELDDLFAYNLDENDQDEEDAEDVFEETSEIEQADIVGEMQEEE